jgi:hypothetical protein
VPYDRLEQKGPPLSENTDDTPISLQCRRDGCVGSATTRWQELDKLPGFECPKCHAYWPLTEADKLTAESEHMQRLRRLQGRNILDIT